jgi:hypothetical protein
MEVKELSMTTEVSYATTSQGQHHSNLEDTIDRIANVLKDAVSSTIELDNSIISLAQVLAEAISGNITEEEANQLLDRSTPTRLLIQELRNNGLRINQFGQTLVEFGQNSNLSDIQISGVAGRDIINISLAVPEPRQSQTFIEIRAKEIERFVFPKFLEPVSMNKLLDHLQTFQQIVIYGAGAVNESEIARYLALRFAQLRVETGQQIRVLAWNRNASLEDVDRMLTKHLEPCIFVMTQVTPDVVGRNFFTVLNPKHHYLVISTDFPSKDWYLESAHEAFWIHLAKEKIYDDELLKRKLLYELNSVDKNPMWRRFLQWSGDPEATSLCGSTIVTLIANLETPEKCELFTKFLHREYLNNSGNITENTQPISARRTNEILHLLDNKKSRIHNWYFATLNVREQFIAIGLSFFDGLSDSQFFAALDQVIRFAWRRLESALSNVDYNDLHNVCGTSFVLYETIHNETIVESIDWDQRRRFFDILWNKHRRRITSALPVLAQLVINSTRSHASRKSDLYGTEQRRRQLRRAIAETFSDVGMLSLGSVSDSLQLLAMDHNWGSQAAAAQAVARWGILGEWNLFLSTLDLWLTPIPGTGTKQREYLQSTVILSINYVLDRQSVDDPIQPDILRLFDKLSLQPALRTRHYLRNQTMPRITPKQLHALGDIYYNLSKHVDLHEAISYSVVSAHNNYWFEAVHEMVTSWSRRLLSVPADSNTAKLVARVIVYILCGTPSIHNDQYFSILEQILKKYNSDTMRTNLRAALRLKVTEMAAPSNRTLIHQLFHLLFSYTPIEEHDILARTMANILVEQRKTTRSFPAIQLVCYTWFSNKIPPAQQRIGLRTLVYTVSKEQNVTTSITDSEEQSTSSVSALLSSYYRRSVVPFLATIAAPEYRSTISNLLPEALEQVKEKSKQLNTVLLEASNSNYAATPTISKYMQAALELYKQRHLVIIVLITAVILVVLLLFLFIRILTQ